MIDPKTTASPAQELRAAASKIRTTAYGTSHTGPWQLGDFEVATESGPIAGVYTRIDGAHIALWHPGIAMLVGDWLVGTAAIAEHGYREVPGQALELARAINAEVTAQPTAEAVQS